MTLARGALLLASVLLGAPATAQTLQSGPVDGVQSQFDRPVRAIVVSRSRTILSSQIAGRIIDMPKRAGEVFAENDILVRFDCTPFLARVAAAQASLDAAKTQLASARRLFELNSVGQHDVDLARSEVAKAEANVAYLSHDVKNCAVRAPFDGRIVERHANPYGSVKAGDRLIEIVDDKDLEIEILVPSIWLRRIAVGSGFKVKLSASNDAFAATVTRFGSDVDTASQTVRVFGTFDGQAHNVLSGMGGNVIFNRLQSSQ